MNLARIHASSSLPTKDGVFTTKIRKKNLIHHLGVSVVAVLLDLALPDFVGTIGGFFGGSGCRSAYIESTDGVNDETQRDQ